MVRQSDVPWVSPSVLTVVSLSIGPSVGLWVGQSSGPFGCSFTLLLSVFICQCVGPSDSVSVSPSVCHSVYQSVRQFVCQYGIGNMK